MLKIKNLKVKREENLILNGLNLTIEPNTIHILMGPNGSGKSTLANTLMGSPNLEVVEGEILLDSKNITKLSPNERAQLGLFLGFQYPVEVPGVPFIQFLKLAYEQRFNKKTRLGEFLKLVMEHSQKLNVPKKLIDRYLNEGFSGGEKKKAEILQMSLLNPKYAILDETDSGLDVSALKTVFNSIKLIQQETKMGVLLITHYSRILNYITPDFVHILYKGKIVKTGDKSLAEKVEERGYDFIH